MHSVANNAAGDGVNYLKTPAESNDFIYPSARLTVAEHLVGVVAAVVPTIAPGAVAHTAPVHAPSVALFAHTVGWDRKRGTIK